MIKLDAETPTTTWAFFQFSIEVLTIAGMARIHRKDHSTLYKYARDPERVPDGEARQDPRELVRTRAARYVCEDCGSEWDDRLRNQAVAGGEWRPRREVADPVSVAFHLPAWNSRFVSLSECAAAELAGRTNAVKRQHFMTQIRSLPWENVIRDADEEHLVELVDADLPPRTVPAGTIALTLAVDMQKGYFVYSVAAHAVRPFRRSWIIDYGEVGPWSDLETIFKTAWPMAGGGRMGIWRGGLDTGGGMKSDSEERAYTRTEEAYLWLQDPARRGRMFGLKGIRAGLSGRDTWNSGR